MGQRPSRGQLPIATRDHRSDCTALRDAACHILWTSCLANCPAGFSHAWRCRTMQGSGSPHGCRPSRCRHTEFRNPLSAHAVMVHALPVLSRTRSVGAAVVVSSAAQALDRAPVIVRDGRHDKIGSVRGGNSDRSRWFAAHRHAVTFGPCRGCRRSDFVGTDVPTERESRKTAE